MDSPVKIDVAVIGGGPAGLMAADVLSSAGYVVHVFEAKASIGRKFLMAGKSGLNITKSEADDIFLDRYGRLDLCFEKAIAGFLPRDVMAWCADLNIETFIGSSGRVFPKAMKASPLLRAWMMRLGAAGVVFHTRHRWTGFLGSDLCFDTPQGRRIIGPRACVFAMGGASWSRLGSDAMWQPALQQVGVDVAPFLPSNCGFDCAWDEHFIAHYAGKPVKAVRISAKGGVQRGDFVITRHGVEGGAVYPLAALLRDDLAKGTAVVLLDLKPDVAFAKVERALSRPRGGNSFANHLRKTVNLSGVKLGLLRMVAPDTDWQNSQAVAQLVKALPLKLLALRPIDEAISTAGGVRATALDERLMLKARAGCFVAGEMLDWDAPTGGYLLTACLATGKMAGEGARDWLQMQAV